MTAKSLNRRSEIINEREPILTEEEKAAKLIVRERENKESLLIGQIRKYNRQQKILEEEIEKLIKEDNPKLEIFQIKVKTPKLSIATSNRLRQIQQQKEPTQQIAELESQQKKNDMQMASDFINFFKKNNIIIEQLSEKPLEVLFKYLSCSNPTIIAKLIKHIIINK